VCCRLCCKVCCSVCNTVVLQGVLQSVFQGDAVCVLLVLQCMLRRHVARCGAWCVVASVARVQYQCAALRDAGCVVGWCPFVCC